MPLKKLNKPKCSFGECRASLSNPKPIKIDFTPSSFSNIGTIGILPPPLLGIGEVPKVSL